jgi:hypothetical protein
MGGCIVVALREQKLNPAGMRSFSRTQLWWLKLNFAGTEIVECGRLLLPGDESDDANDADERSPSVAALSDGKLVVAYLLQRAGAPAWELRVAPIGFDADRRVPEAHPSKSQLLADLCQPAQPSFSSDGRWINAISGPTPSESHVTRFSTRKLVNSAR